MSYTIKNLRQVEDSAPKFGFDSVQEARFARGDLEAQRTGVSLQTVKAGQKQAFAHHHREAEEIYVILSGNGQVKLGDEVRDVRPMDAIRVAPDTARAFAAGEQDLELLAFGTHPEGDQGEMIGAQEFWGGG